MQQKRRYIRLVGPDGRALRIAIKNEVLRALIDRIRVKDISIGGISMIVPGAETVVSSGMPLEMAILPPNEEICWLTGSVVHVAGDVCRVRFDEDFYEQKKLSRYVLQREREISGYVDEEGGPAEAGPGEAILDGIWRGQKQNPERKKILLLSTAGGEFSFLEDVHDLMTVTEIREAGRFKADLLLVDSNHPAPGLHGIAEDPERLLKEKTPVLVSVARRREINFITIVTRHPEGRISYTMSAERFRTEFPEILAALFFRYGRTEEQDPA